LEGLRLNNLNARLIRGGFVFWLCLIVVVGCSRYEIEPPNVSLVEIAEATTTILPATATRYPSTQTKTSTPEPTITPDPIQQPPTTEVTETHIEQWCRETPFPLVSEARQARGLVVYDYRYEIPGTIRYLSIWDSHEYIRFLNFIFDPKSSDPITGRIGASKNKEWYAIEKGFYYGEKSSFDLVVLKPGTGIEYTGHFESIALSRYGENEWIDDAQLAIPLANQGEVYSWLLWSPFTNEQKTISLNLNGIGDSPRKLTPPKLDPLLEFVAYRCDLCDKTQPEFIVKSFKTGEIAWTMDLGPGSQPTYRGIHIDLSWSPDGQYLAVAGEINFKPNGVWIYNRQGKLVQRLVVPRRKDYTVAVAFSWSPNSRYMAFHVVNPVSEKDLKGTIYVLDILNGSVIDLCQHSSGALYWSPDSRFIAFEDEPFADIGFYSRSLIDLTTGEGWRMYDYKRRLIDWIHFYPSDQ
jgi:hypothetical protein